MNFSRRTNWHRQPNRLSELLEQRRQSGKPVFDLTISNPTDCGIEYPHEEILSALANPKAVRYQPHPHGLHSAREAVTAYYRDKNIEVSPSNIFLTASTSEAYSLVFKLLCNAGEAVAVPSPSYPLFEYLARVNDVELVHYQLRYDGEWHVDIDSVNRCLVDAVQAIVLVNPHNPTGMFIKKDEYERITATARQNDLTLIVDEVFVDYPFDGDARRLGSTAGASEVLTFTLNGISKAIGLPQLKLGWIVVSGESVVVSEADARLEILCDTFLSVNTPAQVALPKLLPLGGTMRQRIVDRVRANYRYLCGLVNTKSTITHLASEGGWYAILRIPRTKSEEDWAMELLGTHGVYVFPGYYFDFDQDGYLVVSLLVECERFEVALEKIFAHIQTAG